MQAIPFALALFSVFSTVFAVQFQPCVGPTNKDCVPTYYCQYDLASFEESPPGLCKPRTHGKFQGAASTTPKLT
jgi:hypothetical protein